jgi:hypothetical protein
VIAALSLVLIKEVTQVRKINFTEIMKSQIKLASSALLSFSSVVSMSFWSTPSLSARSNLPQSTCADLQAIANKVGKKKGYSFQGFEGLPMKTDVYSPGVTTRGSDRLCQLGYFTIASPMGKEICRGHIYTNTESLQIRWDIGPFRKSFYDPENHSSEYCRYIK